MEGPGSRLMHHNHRGTRNKSHQRAFRSLDRGDTMMDDWSRGSCPVREQVITGFRASRQRLAKLPAEKTQNVEHAGPLETPSKTAWCSLFALRFE